ncbi:spore coat protein D [Oikeobacillus pervagus]|uniref:Spore coat protein D n=1 Tax=Oikeobacillus pervagus TaxID=1325931 RepID=A0AAJ1WF85_9BACI|nr:CotD family spore coat protein [Oikeobacillus pervagus]MDQ0213647.1 spore coat protein D [Oikeobacillus pervagus]
MFCRPKVLPAVVHPTKCCVNHTNQQFIVPHIHPTHTTNINHQMYQHQHHFPQTQSFVNNVQHQHVNCGRPPFGC